MLPLRPNLCVPNRRDHPQCSSWGTRWAGGDRDDRGHFPKFVFLGEGVEVAKALVTCSEPGRGMEIESYWLKPRVAKTAISAPSDHSTDSGVSLENSRPDSRGSENGDADPTFAIFTEESESVTLQQTSRWASRERHASHNSQTKMSDHQWLLLISDSSDSLVTLERKKKPTNPRSLPPTSYKVSKRGTGEKEMFFNIRPQSCVVYTAKSATATRKQRNATTTT
ncbi:hypothetical protein C0Q70_18907 [Pomacea canaliculata]|uniref:Uncharacterized protein n=1 Tax=Pomacea canaliculata TaxID=400727 RepID=A0A2T7NHW4_POMCA|nr:hypothetical protein C0Q70_18907 [Pomacea canaliculata]